MGTDHLYEKEDTYEVEVRLREGIQHDKCSGFDVAALLERVASQARYIKSLEAHIAEIREVVGREEE